MTEKIKLILKNGYHYTGSIISETQEEIVLFDKFGKKVIIDKSSISVREEVLE
jgi:hypothetical protein